MPDTVLEQMLRQQQGARDELRAKMPAELLPILRQHEAAVAYIMEVYAPRQTTIDFSKFKLASEAIVAYLAEQGEARPLDEIRDACVKAGYSGSNDMQRAFRTAVTAHRIGREVGRNNKWLFTEEPGEMIALAAWQPEVVKSLEDAIRAKSNEEKPDHSEEQSGK